MICNLLHIMSVRSSVKIFDFVSVGKKCGFHDICMSNSCSWLAVDIFSCENTTKICDILYKDFTIILDLPQKWPALTILFSDCSVTEFWKVDICIICFWSFFSLTTTATIKKSAPSSTAVCTTSSRGWQICRKRGRFGFQK